MASPSSLPFTVIEHTVDCQHIRENSRALKKSTDTSQPLRLRLAVKEYRPIEPPPDSDEEKDSQRPAITIIATHANGIPKECYEPLWASLLSGESQLPTNSNSAGPRPRIRSIWIADSSHQNASGVLNETLQGDDPHWFDHSRDLLYMVNQLSEHMVAPIIGIAHSFGCAQFTHLSAMHPSLFAGLIFIEPMVQRINPSGTEGPPTPKGSCLRQDLWETRSAAESSFRNDKFYKAWDPAVLDRYLRYGLRETPTALYSHGVDGVGEGSVTLTTTKAQEVFTFLRFNGTPLSGSEKHERWMGADLSASVHDELDARDWQMTCASSALAFDLLPTLRPPVLWVYAERSFINTPERRADKLRVTGTGSGGSGGAQLGLVSQTVVPGTRHMMPLEKVSDTAASLRDWLAWISGYWAEQRDFLAAWEPARSEGGNGLRLSQEWLSAIKGKAGAKRDEKAKM